MSYPTSTCSLDESLDAPDISVVHIHAHIGNVIRLAALLRPEEVEGACALAAKASPDASLLDPNVAAQSPQDRERDQRLLEVFREFVAQIRSARSGPVLAENAP